MTAKETWNQVLIILRCNERNPQIVISVCRKAQIFARAVKILSRASFIGKSK